MNTDQSQLGDDEHRNWFQRLVCFARSSIGGKKTAEIKFRCPDELKDELARKARALGFRSESELSETLMSIALFGYDHVETVQRERLQRVASLFPNAALRGQAHAPVAEVRE